MSLEHHHNRRKIVVETLILHMASGQMNYVPQTESELETFKEHARFCYHNNARFNQNVNACANTILAKLNQLEGGK